MHPQRPRWPPWVTKSTVFVFKIARGVPTASPPRVASTEPRTTGTTAIQHTVSFTTRKRAETFVLERATSGGSLRSVPTSSIKRSPKVFRLPVNTVECLPTARLVACLSKEPFTAAVRRVSNCCWVLAQHWHNRLGPATSSCIPAANC